MALLADSVHPVLAALTALDYRPLLNDVLEEPYDGVNEILRGEPGRTWYGRFFDYL